MNRHNFYFTARDDGAPPADVVIHEARYGDRRVTVTEVGVTRDADYMLAGRVETWTPYNSRAVGILFDTARIVVFAGEPLESHEAAALRDAGFSGVEAFCR